MASTLLLFPGAGASREQPALRAIDAEVSARKGWNVVRADFPYRTEGRRAPDRPPVLLQAVRDEIAEIGARRDLVVGGRSMGGRICSMIAGGADGSPPPKRLKAVVTISYPLHPPGKPERLRVEHLPSVTVPWLFVQGTKDPFGTPAELEQWAATIAGPVTFCWIDGKGHDLKGADRRVAEFVADWLTALS